MQKVNLMDHVIKDMVAAFYMKSHCMSLEDTIRAIEIALDILPEFIVLDAGTEPKVGDTFRTPDGVFTVVKKGIKKYDNAYCTVNELATIWEKFSKNKYILECKGVPVLTRRKAQQ